MKILFVSEHYKHNIQGGGEINLFSLCEELFLQGHDVTVLTSYREGKKGTSIMNNVTVYHTLKTGNVGSIFGNLKRQFFFSKSIISELQKLLRVQSFDAIHLIGSALEAAPKIKKITKVPVFSTIESYISLCPKGDFIFGKKVDISVWSLSKFIHSVLVSSEIGKVQNKWFLKYNPLAWFLIYSRFKKLNGSMRHVRLITVSSFVQKIVKDLYGLKSNVVPNFVDVKRFSHHQKKKNKVLHVTYLGSLTKYKGAHVLVEALKDLDCFVTFYGNGTLKNFLQNKMKEYGIKGKIVAPVSYKKVPEIYALSDLIIFPSLWPEPFGRIAIEAMAGKTPIIGSNIGGISETIVKGTGKLFEPGNAKELNMLIKKMIEQKQDKKMVHSAFNHVKDNYSPKVVVSKLVKLYEGAMHG